MFLEPLASSLDVRRQRPPVKGPDQASMELHNEAGYRCKLFGLLFWLSVMVVESFPVDHVCYCRVDCFYAIVGDVHSVLWQTALRMRTAVQVADCGSCVSAAALYRLCCTYPRLVRLVCLNGLGCCCLWRFYWHPNGGNANRHVFGESVHQALEPAPFKTNHNNLCYLDGLIQFMPCSHDASQSGV